MLETRSLEPDIVSVETWQPKYLQGETASQLSWHKQPRENGRISIPARGAVYRKQRRILALGKAIELVISSNELLKMRKAAVELSFPGLPILR